MDWLEVVLEFCEQGRDGLFRNGEQARDNTAHAALFSKAEESCNDTAGIGREFDGKALHLDCHKDSYCIGAALASRSVCFCPASILNEAIASRRMPALWRSCSCSLELRGNGMTASAPSPPTKCGSASVTP